MNLNQSPTVDELKKIFMHANDDAGNHSLWVDKSGEVHVSLIPTGLTPIGFEKGTLSMALRYETFCRGNGYVGVNAAADNEHINSLFLSLIKEWQELPKQGRVKFVDNF